MALSAYCCCCFVCFVPWQDFGFLTLCAGLEHGVLHCIRFIYSHNAWLIYETDVGRSGMVGCMLLLPIVLPMKFEFFRTKVQAAT